jgi:hypothetical protein
MAKLTAKQRRKVPRKDFGLPGGKGLFPMPDKNHVEAAIFDLPKAKITTQQKQQVKRKIAVRKKQLGMK